MRLLNQALVFPDPRLALKGEHNGLLAVGGDLSIERLLLAYRSGIFPWSVDPITWWSPDPRAIFDWDRLHISRSLDKFLRKNPFRFTHNQAFREVMIACARPGPGRTSTWITSEFVDAYSILHQAGHAHSVECWKGDVLVGGIYGVQVGGFFAGESMFHHESNASKAALLYLLSHLKSQGFDLFDTQVINPTTEQLGAIEVSREDYLRRLKHAVERHCTFH